MVTLMMLRDMRCHNMQGPNLAFLDAGRDTRLHAKYLHMFTTLYFEKLLVRDGPPRSTATFH